jgi:hypothetical protein
MKPTQQLHDLGQSLWLDNITRGLLVRRSRSLQRGEAMRDQEFILSERDLAQRA